ncbi:MAG: hypothetical protein CMH81_04720 [Nitrospiraceae bacterium]|nr:hypothetical protein [Nitrospiraceae bacterium]
MYVDCATLTKLPLKHLGILGVVWGLFLCNAAVVLCTPITKESPTGTSLHIIDSNGSGKIVATIPIHRSGDMRYFVTGIGRLERDATYLSFPVKLVFSRASGTYLAFIAVTIWKVDGTQVGQIPASDVKGPWVFLDLADGEYRIDVVKDNDIKTRTNVEVITGQQQTLFFRWP